MDKKGQSAMEYLMTYGWAIIVVTIAVIVIWQLGIFSIGSTTGPGYSGFGEVNLADFSYTSSGTFRCVLTNDAGGAVTIDAVTAKIHGTDYTDATLTPLEPGESGGFTMDDCPEGIKGDRYDLVLVISFTDETTTVSHTSSGNMWGNYE